MSLLKHVIVAHTLLFTISCTQDTVSEPDATSDDASPDVSDSQNLPDQDVLVDMPEDSEADTQEVDLEPVDLGPPTCSAPQVPRDGVCGDCEQGTTFDMNTVECEPILCGENERVDQHTCVPCEEGLRRVGGDKASGQDTRCETDECMELFGVLCAQFEESYIKASNPDPSDFFGFTVALEGDTLVVGAPDEESSGEDDMGNSYQDAGAVYIFERTGTTWAQTAYLKSHNCDPGDLFGYDVAIDGDTIVIGAPGEDSGSNYIDTNWSRNDSQDSGAAYVFKRSEQGWMQQSYIKASNSSRENYFGLTVAIDQGTIVIGAPAEQVPSQGINNYQEWLYDDPQRTFGAVYVYVETEDSWAQQAYIKASNARAYRTFGKGISLVGDLLIVGDPNENINNTGVFASPQGNPCISCGAIYVFEREESQWFQRHYIKAPVNSIDGFFGHDVYTDGTRIVVGEPGADATLPGGDEAVIDRGAVHIYSKEEGSGGWAYEATLRAHNLEHVRYFGERVRLQNGMIVVGAQSEPSRDRGLNGEGDDSQAPDSGAVYAFTIDESNSTWSQNAYIKARYVDRGDRFGADLAFDEGTLAIGAPGEASSEAGVDALQLNNSAPSSGAVYIRRLTP